MRQIQTHAKLEDPSHYRWASGRRRGAYASVRGVWRGHRVCRLDSADDARYVFYSVPQTGFLAVIEPENKQTKFKLHFLDPSGDTPPRGLIFPMRASLRFLILVAWMLSNPSLGHFRVSKSISIVQTTINRKPRGRGRVSPPTCGFTRNHLRKFLPMIYAQLCH